MAYALGNKCVNNCDKRTILIQLIVEDVDTCFWNTVYNNSKAAKIAFEHIVYGIIHQDNST